MMDWDNCPGVESVPGKLSGAWVFTGTRLPVSALFGNLAEGANIEELWIGSMRLKNGRSRPYWST